MKKYIKGFSLIELMIVVAIVGILAAIFLPLIYPHYFHHTSVDGSTYESVTCK